VQRTAVREGGDNAMKRKFIIIAVAVAVVTFVVLFALLSGDQGAITFYRTWRHIGDLQREIVQANRSVDSLKMEIERLKNDTAHIERIAREKFGMARDNEKMYKFIEEK
jgi:cell division protein FtsB